MTDYGRTRRQLRLLVHEEMRRSPTETRAERLAAYARGRLPEDPGAATCLVAGVVEALAESGSRWERRLAAEVYAELVAETRRP